VQLGDALRAPERDFPNEDRPWLPRGYKFEKNLAEANEVAIRLLQVRPTEWPTAWFCSARSIVTARRTALRIMV
jgi:hypothetical protein